MQYAYQILEGPRYHLDIYPDARRYQDPRCTIPPVQDLSPWSETKCERSSTRRPNQGGRQTPTSPHPQWDGWVGEKIQTRLIFLISKLKSEERLDPKVQKIQLRLKERYLRVGLKDVVLRICTFLSLYDCKENKNLRLEDDRSALLKVAIFWTLDILTIPIKEKLMV